MSDTFKLWGTYYPGSDEIAGFFLSEGEAIRHAYDEGQEVVALQLHRAAPQERKE